MLELGAKIVLTVLAWLLGGERLMVDDGTVCHLGSGRVALLGGEISYENSCC